MKTRLPFCLSLCLLVLWGCTHPQPRVVRASDPSQLAHLKSGEPFIIEFQEGDKVPLKLGISGQLVELEGAEGATLTVKKHFFLRVDESGIRTSLDAEHFEKAAKPGAFRFGVGAKAGEPLAFELSITTPEHK